ncbi:hypothetical protein KKC63_00300 [Patescibacteria group bacterium]|nr:hypothetical protein [Patescibacteria group bacterium]MBU4022767.1 hypothetical protein [Patescibacteria group bacterium]
MIDRRLSHAEHPFDSFFSVEHFSSQDFACAISDYTNKLFLGVLCAAYHSIFDILLGFAYDLSSIVL